MNVCVIPCFNRPAFLQVCLEQIQKADGWRDISYLFALDHGYNTAIDRVIDTFDADKRIIRMPKHEYSKLTKQSRNVLNAYVVACNMGAELVYLIEDDIFIGKDFFTFHEAIHSSELQLPVSILTANNNTKYRVSSDSDAYYLSVNGDYQSLGVCWKAEAFLEHIYPFFTASYLSRPREYVMKHWPNSQIGTAFCEQDGLIRRIIEKRELPVAFAHVPRAFHGGFTGANRGLEIAVTTESIRRIAFNLNELKKVVKRPEFIADSMPCDLNTSHTKAINIPCQKS